MRIVRHVLWALGFLTSGLSLAQYGLPETLKAEMNQGGDLFFAKETKQLGVLSNLSNAVFVPPKMGEGKLPALIIMPSCGGISQHTRLWTDEALKRNYIVLPVDFMRGHKNDCGSPPKLSNGRLVKDALDAVAHLSTFPQVDSQRISIIGFSKGAMMASWVSSSSVANALRPGTPPIASAVSAYAFCAFGPTRGRPQGITIVQPDTDRPLLALLGGKDAETPPASCLELLPKLKTAGAPVQWHLYPDATHSWDAPHLDGFSKIDFKNERVTYKYDPEATKDSMERVFDFFAKSSGAASSATTPQIPQKN